MPSFVTLSSGVLTCRFTKLVTKLLGAFSVLSLFFLQLASGIYKLLKIKGYFIFNRVLPMQSRLPIYIVVSVALLNARYPELALEIPGAFLVLLIALTLPYFSGCFYRVHSWNGAKCDLFRTFDLDFITKKANLPVKGAA